MDRGRRLPIAALAGGLALTDGAAEAHHSFAVFFSSDQDVIPLTGVVKEFHFTNPHGIIKIVVPAGAGKPEQDWTLETNSPSILVRRGWNKDIMKVGDVITVQGWPARDGTNYMRLRNASRADGTPIGTAPAVQ